MLKSSRITCMRSSRQSLSRSILSITRMRGIKIRSTAHNKKHPIVRQSILNALLQFGQDAISLLAMAGILWWLHWGVIPVLMLTALPYFFVRLQQSNRLFAWERERTPLERKAWYVNMLLTQAHGSQRSSTVRPRPSVAAMVP